MLLSRRGRNLQLEMSHREYAAFVSYSRRDEAQARWLQRKLEAYRIPRGLTAIDGKPVPRRLRPVFRDNEELASSASLSTQIAEALAISRSLIVIASPHAAVSRWVNEEIRQYRRGAPRPIVVMVIDGTPYTSEHPESGQAEALPLAIRRPSDAQDGPREEEPNYADVRNGGRNLAFLRITAGILQVSFDDLRQRHARRLRQLVAIWATLVLTSSAVAWTVYDRSLRTARVAQELEQSAEARSRAPALSLLLAREAWNEGGALTPEVETAVRRAMERNTGRAASADGPLVAMAVKPRSSLFITASSRGGLTLWDAAAPGNLRGTKLSQVEGEIKSISMADDGSLLAINTTRAVHRWALSADGKLSDHRQLEVGLTDRVLSLATAGDFWAVRSAFATADGSMSPSTQLLAYSWERAAAPPRVLASFSTIALTAAVTADKRHVAIATGGGQLHLCAVDGTSDASCRTLDACRAGEYVMQVAFSPGGEWIAAACMGGDIVAWPVASPTTPTPPVSCVGHRSWANQLAFSDDGRWFASASTDTTVRLWTWPCGTEEPHVLPTDHVVEHVAFSDAVGEAKAQSAPPRLAAADATGEVYLWSLTPYEDSHQAIDVTGKDRVARTLIRLPGHQGSTQIAFAGPRLGSAGVDGTVRAWATDDSDPTGASDLLPSLEYSDQLVASPDGNWLAVNRSVLTNAPESPLLVWRLGDGDLVVRQLEGVSSGVTTAAFDPKGRWFAAAKGGKVLLLPIEKAALGKPTELDPRSPMLAALQTGGSDAVNAVAFASDGSWLASGGAKGKLAVWYTSGSQPQRSFFTFDIHGDVERIFPLPDPRSFVTLTREGCARLWDPSMAVGRIFDETCGFDDARFSELTPDGKWLVWGGDHALHARALDAATGFERRAELEGVSDTIRALAVGAQHVAVATADGSVLLWELAAGADVSRARPLATEEHSEALAISRDGRWLASANSDGRVVTWDLLASDPKLTRVEIGHHQHNARGVSFLGDQRLATTGGDLVFFTGDRDGSAARGVRIWRLGASQLAADLQAAAGRNLTREEWTKYLPHRPYQLTFPNLGEPPVTTSAPAHSAQSAEAAASTVVATQQSPSNAAHAPSSL